MRKSIALPLTHIRVVRCLRERSRASDPTGADRPDFDRRATAESNSVVANDLGGCTLPVSRADRLGGGECFGCDRRIPLWRNRHWRSDLPEFRGRLRSVRIQCVRERNQSRHCGERSKPPSIRDSRAGAGTGLRESVGGPAAENLSAVHFPHGTPDTDASRNWTACYGWVLDD